MYKAIVTIAAFSLSMLLSTGIIKKWIVPLRKPEQEEENDKKLNSNKVRTPDLREVE